MIGCEDAALARSHDVSCRNLFLDTYVVVVYNAVSGCVFFLLYCCDLLIDCPSIEQIGKVSCIYMYSYVVVFECVCVFLVRFLFLFVLFFVFLGGFHG